MPEGDNLHRLAAALSRVLAGRMVRALTAHAIDDAVAHSLVGHAVTSVEARGKNLLVAFDDERTLHVHLRMLGRVRIERRAGAQARGLAHVRTPPHAPELRLEVDDAIVTGHHLPVVRVLRAGATQRDPTIAALGPDVLGEAFDEAEAVRRLRTLGGRAIGEALLVQRAVAGIGNVYKSEVLFLERVDPAAAVRSLDDARLVSILRRCRALMQQNVRSHDPRRRTRASLGGPRLWVYGRANRPCLVCGATIVCTRLSTRQGAAAARTTYHCPSCQRPSPSLSAESDGAARDV